MCYKKVNCTLVQALRLCTGRRAHRGSRGIALPFHDHGTRRGWGVSVTPRPLFTPGKDPVPIVQEAGWAPGPVWTGAENLASTGIRTPNRPARSQSLYRQRYPAHSCVVGFTYFTSVCVCVCVIAVIFGTPFIWWSSYNCAVLSVLLPLLSSYVQIFPSASCCKISSVRVLSLIRVEFHTTTKQRVKLWMAWTCP
jgi:hypothetical protein